MEWQNIELQDITFKKTKNGKFQVELAPIHLLREMIGNNINSCYTVDGRNGRKDVSTFYAH